MERLKLRIEGMIERLSEALSDGQAQSWDQYKQYVGRIEGLRLALMELDEVEKLTLDE
jgi:hypothetical protein